MLKTKIRELSDNKYLKNTDYVVVDGFDQIMDEYEEEHFEE